jgi:hypothetical protein
MAYQIDRFNGSFLVSIDDQTLNTTATDLRLVGRNYSGYGELQNENFVHLLENFAGATSPPRSISGQIWYDSVNRKLKYYDGTRYKVASGAEASADAPAGLSPGDLWFNTVEQQVFTWSGSEFILVGPERTPTAGDTLVEPQEVRDVLGNTRVVLKLVSGGKTVALISQDQFTINSSLTPINGFSIINRGINLAELSPNGYSSDLYRLYGTVTNSLRLNGLTSDDFLRSSNTVFNSQVKFNDNGLIVGDQNDLRIRVINGNEPVIENTIGGNLFFRISDGANSNDPAIITSEGIFPGRNDIFLLGRSGIRWKEVNAETINATTFYGKFVGTIESPPPGSPGGPPIGQPVPPLALQSGLSVSGNFSMNSGNFEIILNPEDTIRIKSGSTGFLDNVEINPENPRNGSFTILKAIQSLEVIGIDSSTSTNGALTVSGGVGITGNLNVGGNANFLGSGTLTIPVGNTSQRPLSPVIGMIRYNTDLENFEGYDGENWRIIGSDSSDDYGELVGTITISQDYEFVNELHDTSLDYGGLF